MKTVTLAVVVYSSLGKQQCRATVREGNYSLVIEYPAWTELFGMLDNQKLDYEIPDEIEVIILDKSFKPTLK